MKTILTFYKPYDALRWNALCEEEGNVVQHQLYDAINASYSYVPVYVEIYQNDRLVAGIKLYYYESNKLKFITKFISKRISILGECLIASSEKTENLMPILQKEVNAFIDQHNIVEATISGYYGNSDKLICLNKEKLYKEHLFNTANIDLTLPEETLWNNLHSKHRNVVRKAEKENVEFFEQDDFNLFKSLLQETYAAQGNDHYNTRFTELFYNHFKQAGLAKLYFAKHAGECLSSAMVICLGKKVYYAYGGNKHNSLGAGNFLQWRIFLELKKDGYEVYCLGQVAIELDENNQKFTVGISQFKTRFGTYELPSFKRIYLFHPLRNKLFKWLIEIKK